MRQHRQKLETFGPRTGEVLDRVQRVQVGLRACAEEQGARPAHAAFAHVLQHAEQGRQATAADDADHLGMARAQAETTVWRFDVECLARQLVREQGFSEFTAGHLAHEKGQRLAAGALRRIGERVVAPTRQTRRAEGSVLAGDELHRAVGFDHHLHDVVRQGRGADDAAIEGLGRRQIGTQVGDLHHRQRIARHSLAGEDVAGVQLLFRERVAEVAQGLDAAFAQVRLARAAGADRAVVRVRHALCEGGLKNGLARSECDADALRPDLDDRFGLGAAEERLDDAAHEALLRSVVARRRPEGCRVSGLSGVGDGGALRGGVAEPVFPAGAAVLFGGELALFGVRKFKVPLLQGGLDDPAEPHRRDQ